MIYIVRFLIILRAFQDIAKPNPTASSETNFDAIDAQYHQQAGPLGHRDRNIDGYVIVRPCSHHQPVGLTTVLIAVMALLSLIFYYAFPDKPYHVTAATVLAKMYSNSVLAIFNSRIRIVGGRDDWTDNGQNLCLSLHPGGVKNSSRADSSVAASQLSAIRVQEDIYVHSDAIPLEGQVSIWRSRHCHMLSCAYSRVHMVLARNS